MPEEQSDKPNPDIPLDVTEAVAPATTDRPLTVTGAALDVTTDFDESDSAPSAQRLGQLGAMMRSPVAHQTVADYRLETKLGEGGMGRVFKALDSHGRAVAIKLLSPHLACSDEALQRFKQEGYIASQINHPHCVFVHRVDEDRGIPFIAMELMTGKTLKDLVQKDGALPYREAVRLILQCIDGLIEAHRLGMIHRDIKPANCYLDEDNNVKIGDFGLARSLVDDSELTRTGAFLGTPLFASPEQLLGNKIDERSDIYSLSATLYYLLAGRAPFESPNAAQVIAKIASSDPLPFREYDVKVPAALEAVVMHGLARDRDKRFESFQKMRAALLPMIAPEREIASLPRRAMAGFLDICIFSVLFRMSTVAISSLIGVSVVNLPSLMPFFTSIGWFFYLWLLEWLAGWTIGKRIVKLKVVDSQLGMRQGPRKLLIRTSIFVAAFESLKLLCHALLSQPGEPPSGYAAAVSFVVGLAVILAAWRKSGSRQLTHELLSQTETCLAVPQRAAVSAQLELPDWSLPTTEPRDCPATLGRFTIKGQLRCGEASQWLLAHDVKLEREVWIHWLPAGAPPLSVERKALTSRTRMRVVESGAEQGRQWDAFMAPDGIPMSVFIRFGSHLPWPIAQHLIHQLTSDAEMPADDVSTADRWDANRYWLDATGRMTFAEANIELGSASESSRPEELLQQVALAALPPKHRLRRQLKSPRAAHQSTCQVADLPTYSALRLLERMASRRLELSQIRSELVRVNRAADQVTPYMRFVHAATVALLMSPLMLTVMIMLVVNMVIRFEFLLRTAQTLASVNYIQKFPEKFPLAFKGLTAEQSTQWLSPEKIEQIRLHKEQIQSELKLEFAHANPFERVALNSMKVDQAFVEGDLVPEDMLNAESGKVSSSTQSPTEKVAEIKAPVVVRIGGVTNFTRPVEVLLSEVDSDPKLLQVSRLSDDQRSISFFIMVIPLTLTIIWTGLTRGGLIPLLTGVTVVRRDGCRIGWLRAGLRCLILFAPFVILGWTIVELEAAGAHWLWLTAQLKIALSLLPIFYLVGALIWPQQGPHDRLCQTIVVPR